MNVGRGCWVMSSCRCLMVLPCVHLTMYVYGFVSAQDVLGPWGPRPSSDVSMGCHVTSFDHSDGFCTIVGLTFLNVLGSWEPCSRVLCAVIWVVRPGMGSCVCCMKRYADCFMDGRV